MPFGRGNDGKDINDVKSKISEQLNGLNVDNLSANDVKNMIINEINNNQSLNIDDSVKEKINKGDIDGLKEEIINYLGRNKSKDGSSEKLVEMLKNNDMDGLRNQLMGMLFSNMTSQKKNEVGQDNKQPGDEKSSTANGDSNSSGFDTNFLFNMLTNSTISAAKNDKRVILLNSIKPFVSDGRQKSIEDCIRIISIMGFFERFGSKAGS